MIEEFPYEGEFYYTKEEESEDGDLLGESTPTESEISVLVTKCDIQEASKMFNSGALIADYNVYFPYPNETHETAVRRGFSFRGSLHGVPVSGTVTGLFPCQLGVKATIKEVDV